MTSDAAKSDFLPHVATRPSITDSLVAELSSEFPASTPCEIRVAALQAAQNLWPKKDAYLLLDHARDLVRRGLA